MIRKSSGQVTATRAVAFLTSANGAHLGAGYAEAPGALIFLAFLPISFLCALPYGVRLILRLAYLP